MGLFYLIFSEIVTTVRQSERFRFWMVILFLVFLSEGLFIYWNLSNSTFFSQEGFWAIPELLLFAIFFYVALCLAVVSLYSFFISEEKGWRSVERRRFHKSVTSEIIAFIFLSLFWIYLANAHATKSITNHHRDGFFLLIFWSLYYIDNILWKINYRRVDFSEVELNKSLILLLRFGSIYGSILSIVMLFWLFIYTFLEPINILHSIYGADILEKTSNYLLYSLMF